MTRNRTVSYALTSLAVAVSVLTSAGSAHAYLPGDAILRYDAYVPGQGWTDMAWSGQSVGPNIPHGHISAVQIYIARWPDGGMYPDTRYHICYSIKQSGSDWSPEGCDGADVGMKSGGSLQNLRARLIAPRGVAADVCYGVADDSYEFEPTKCDGGAATTATVNSIPSLWLETTGWYSTGNHPRSVWELASADRRLLASKIAPCVTQDVINHHMMINHEYGPDILKHHRMMLETMETCLVQHNASQFVPLPYWSPGEPIPQELTTVVQVGGNYYPPIASTQPWRNPNIDSARPEGITGSSIYWHSTLDDLANWEFVQWHNGVHDAVGGSMELPETSPAAVIFWPWHAYVDNIYAQWEQAHQQ